MHDKQGKEHARHPWRFALALCCALLLVFGATIQVAHVHTAAESISRRVCSLCDCARSYCSGSTRRGASRRQTNRDSGRRSATHLCSPLPGFFSLHTTPARCHCFFLSNFSNQIVKMPRGSVYVLVSQTFCLSLFSISAANASCESACPDCVPALFPERSQMRRAR